MNDSGSVEHPQVPPHPAPPAVNKSDPLSIVSLVTGICGLVFWWIPVLGFLSSVAGVVTGIVNLYQRRPGRGLAIAGLVTGGVGVLGTVLFWLFVILAIIGFSQGSVVDQSGGPGFFGQSSAAMM